MVKDDVRVEHLCVYFYVVSRKSDRQCYCIGFTLYCDMLYVGDKDEMHVSV